MYTCSSRLVVFAGVSHYTNGRVKIDIALSSDRYPMGSVPERLADLWRDQKISLVDDLARETYNSAISNAQTSNNGEIADNGHSRVNTTADVFSTGLPSTQSPIDIDTRDVCPGETTEQVAYICCIYRGMCCRARGKYNDAVSWFQRAREHGNSSTDYLVEYNTLLAKHHSRWESWTAFDASVVYSDTKRLRDTIMSDNHGNFSAEKVRVLSLHIRACGQSRPATVATEARQALDWLSTHPSVGVTTEKSQDSGASVMFGYRERNEDDMVGKLALSIAKSIRDMVKVGGAVTGYPRRDLVSRMTPESKGDLTAPEQGSPVVECACVMGVTGAVCKGDGQCMNNIVASMIELVQTCVVATGVTTMTIIDTLVTVLHPDPAAFGLVGPSLLNRIGNRCAMILYTFGMMCLSLSNARGADISAALAKGKKLALRALNFDPMYLPAAYLAGYCSLFDGDVQGCAKHLLMCTGEQHYRAGDAATLLGCLYASRGMPVEALTQFQFALRLAPKDTGAMYNASVQYRVMEDGSSEYRMLEYVHEFHTPQQSFAFRRDALLTLAQMHCRVGRYRDSEQVLYCVLDLDRRSTAPPVATIDVFRLLAIVVASQGDFSRALTLARDMLVTHPQHVGVLRTCADIITSTGHPEHALLLLERALATMSRGRKRPRGHARGVEFGNKENQMVEMEVLNNLGTVEQCLGRTSRARDYFLRAHECVPDHALPVYNLVLWHLAHGEGIEASKLWLAHRQVALDHEPSFYDTRARQLAQVSGATGLGKSGRVTHHVLGDVAIPAQHTITGICLRLWASHRRREVAESNAALYLKSALARE